MGLTNMSYSDDILAILVGPPLPEWKKRFLSVDVPITVRQSLIQTFFSCNRKFLYSHSGEKTYEYINRKLLFGLVFHKMCEDTSRDVVDILHEINEENKVSRDDWNTVKSMWFDKSVYYGLSANDLVRMTVGQLSFFGYKLGPKEYRLSGHKIGNVTFDGALDILVEKDKRIGVLDIKTNGLADMFFGEGSVKASEYTEVQTQISPQLNHYAWMLYRFYNISVDFQGYLLPANLIPLQKGKDKGGARGKPMVIYDSMGSDFLENVYEEDLLNTVKYMEYCFKNNSFPRGYPSVFGKISCETCPFSKQCLGIQDENVSRPEYL